MRDQLFPVFQKSCKKAELLKIVYQNPSKLIKSDKKYHYFQYQIYNRDRIYQDDQTSIYF